MTLWYLSRLEIFNISEINHSVKGNTIQLKPLNDYPEIILDFKYIF
jgi:hypothetical protein